MSMNFITWKQEKSASQETGYVAIWKSLDILVSWEIATSLQSAFKLVKNVQEYLQALRNWHSNNYACDVCSVKNITFKMPK